MLGSFVLSSVWDKINPPRADEVVPYADLPESTDGSILRKLAVLKLNGGLGQFIRTGNSSPNVDSS